jgi:hypothetical protein
MHPKWVNQDWRFALLHRRPPCVVKQKLYPGFTRFRGILSLIQVYFFEIYVKFCVFWYPSWGGLKKLFFLPLLCADALLCGRARAQARDRKLFFLPVSHVLHQNETTAGWQDPQNKIFIKNQLTLLSTQLVVVGGSGSKCDGEIQVGTRPRPV